MTDANKKTQFSDAALDAMAGADCKERMRWEAEQKKLKQLEQQAAQNRSLLNFCSSTGTAPCPYKKFGVRAAGVAALAAAGYGALTWLRPSFDNKFLKNKDWGMDIEPSPSASDKTKPGRP